MRDEKKIYPCPCCGYIMFSEPPGSYEICEICYWEDDDAQLRHPAFPGGANHVSLIEAQKNFKEFGASEKRLLNHVREIKEGDERDLKWRPFDVKEDSLSGKDIDKDEDVTIKAGNVYYWCAENSA